MTSSKPGRNKIFDLCSKRREADGISLIRQEIGKRRGKRFGIIGFGVTDRTEVHGLAGVQQQEAPQVCFVFESFDVVAIRPRKQLPVKMPQVVSLRVLPIFREFD